MDDLQTINVIKGLIIDGVNKAKSGHPGGAMSSLDFAYILHTEFLNFDPDDPKWIGRDRFILSAGHESMLLYSLLHMIGWLPMDELKKFRQLHSKTPGHPENYITPGVECTTGPLGQGAAMSVGFAMAARHLGARLDEKLFSHRTYALLGDGCIQEDVTLGAASLAGHWKLNNLIWYYDKNRCQISGHIDRATSDDETSIFRGFGWQVLEIDGHDHQAIRKALIKAQTETNRPTLIIGNSVMAKGVATMEGDHETHGAPLPAEERTKTRKLLGLEGDDFYCPPAAIQHFQKNFAAKRAIVNEWKQQLTAKQTDKKFTDLYRQCFVDTEYKNLPHPNWPRDKGVATRNAYGDIIEKWVDALPQFVGGSADLEPSNMTGPFAKKVGDFTGENPAGRNLCFGVREFPMAAISNGIALHGGLIPFDATFLVFSDYARPALRLGAIQKIRVIHEFTHDSFYLGEDGPTHQPIEHVMSLRAIPDFYVMRPGDAYETEVLMRKAIHLKHPSAICLTRQKLNMLPVTQQQVENAARGAYVVLDDANAEYLLMASGSEVNLALKVAAQLPGKCRVVSMPCWELFAEQTPEYREQVLPAKMTKRISIEAGTTFGWQKFTGFNGLNIGVDHFGDSAPMEDLEKAYGFTPAAIVEKLRQHRFA